MKKFAYAASVLLLTGAAAGVCQSAVAQTAPATDAPAAAPAPAPALTANVTLASQYRYRGIMQTNNKPAIQGGFDYAIPGGVLPEGFYIGNWNSSISWLSDSNSNVSAPIEMDFYGGYKTEIVKDGWAAYYKGDYEQALALFSAKKAEAAAKKNPSAEDGMGWTLLAQGKAEAEPRLRERFLPPHDPTPQLTSGRDESALEAPQEGTEQ